MTHERVRLSTLFEAIESADRVGDYASRYALVLQAVGIAAKLGYDVGFDIDLRVDPPGYPIVAYIELPGWGQLSWHMPVHVKPFDGHTTTDKYRRIMNYNIDSFS
jgi:hypothetical protein